MPEEILETPQAITPTEPTVESSTRGRSSSGRNWTKIILAAVLGLGLLAASAYAGYWYGTQQVQQPEKPTPVVSQPTPKPTPTPTTPTEPTDEVDETADWKTYSGEYFSFRYPSNWTDNTGSTANYIEITGLRISPEAVFEASYGANDPIDYYEKQGYQVQTINVAGRNAQRVDVPGKGSVLPVGYSIIVIRVEGENNNNYSLVFNGENEGFPENLINQILSTFKFLD